MGVIGASAIGVRHIEMLSHQVPGARVTAVYDPDPDRVDAVRLVAPAAIRRGEVTGASAWDGYLAQQLGDACWTASVTGTTLPVHLPPTPALYRRAQSDA